MIAEVQTRELARRFNRRTVLGKGLFAGFVAVASAMVGASRAITAEACTGCSACSGHWCNCSDCYGSGYCYTQSDLLGNLTCTSDYDCGYRSTGCWTIDYSGGKACCDCWDCNSSPSPCTCRPHGYGC